jgi:galactokinase
MSKNIPGILGARMHGAGWGGSILFIVQKSMCSSVTSDLFGLFQEKYDRKPVIFDLSFSEGAHQIHVDQDTLVANSRTFLEQD